MVKVMQALPLWASALGEVHVLAAIVVMLVVLPALAAPPYWRDSRGAVLVAGLAFWAIVAPILSYLPTFRYAMTGVVVVAVIITRMLTSRVDRDGDRRLTPWLGAWDLLEFPRRALDIHWRTLKSLMRDSWVKSRKEYGHLGILLIGAALAWSLIYGSLPWLRQVAPGTPNGYVTLLGIAGIAGHVGINGSSAAPVGIQSFGAVLASLFFIPPLDVLRFLHPLTNVLMILAAGAFSRRLTHSGRVSALVMFFLAVSSITHLGLARNFVVPLDVRWALIFVLLAWSESLRWGESGTRVRDGVLAMLCLLSATLGDPVVAAIGLVVAVPLVLRRGWRGPLWGVLAVILGLVPFAVAFSLGHAINPDGWLQGGAMALAPFWRTPQAPLYWTPSLALILSGIGLVRPSLSARRPYYLALGAVGALTLALAWIPWVALSLLWSGLLGVMALVAILDLLTARTNGNPAWMESRLAFVSLAVMGALFLSGNPALSRYEPPLAAAATLKIEESFPSYQWVIVSPVDQYSEVLGRGWHEELFRFVKTYPLADARKPRFWLKHDAAAPLTSANIFLFVEPRLFPGGQLVARHDLSLPIATGGPVYQDRSLLAVESRAYYWAISYHRSHPATSSIYFRGRYLMVLWIRQ